MSKDDIADHLDFMAQSVRLVNERFSKIDKPDDFVTSTDGVTILDAISMRLQVIGESVKQIQKLSPSFLIKHPEIE
jgi:uncharacterized protein with HEPN domain